MLRLMPACYESFIFLLKKTVTVLKTFPCPTVPIIQCLADNIHEMVFALVAMHQIIKPTCSDEDSSHGYNKYPEGLVDVSQYRVPLLNSR